MAWKRATSAGAAVEIGHPSGAVLDGVPSFRGFPCRSRQSWQRQRGSPICFRVSAEEEEEEGSPRVQNRVRVGKPPLDPVGRGKGEGGVCRASHQRVPPLNLES